ncbi:pilus assembly protein [Thioalkalivibrio sp. K90mix]|uniref:type IV pilin protein n=1 Tax=Thioalkalivibrio sp. (strain K90mix) TaxID=396595 RepID=UPI000195A381|nr:type IV pilin protein [Thioalkalivibrio sp. K90mix]ADC70735.1 pilus assembly protein [Thioalkalivibrio sp. K90mix]
MRRQQNRPKGFTLIELMIVVAVIAIIAVIAYPAYQNHILKAQRADAHDSLLRIQLEQERFRANNPEYAGNSELTESRPVGLGLNDVTDDGHYNLAISSSSGSGFTATATATGRQANDSSCGTITLEVSGGQAARTPEACW